MPRRNTAADAVGEDGTLGPSSQRARVARQPPVAAGQGQRQRTTAAPTDVSSGKASRERGARTRLIIIEALLELVSERSSPPTAPALATRAGVSVRLLFHHYRDMEAIYEAAFEHLACRCWGRVSEIAPELGLEERIAQTVKARAQLFEAVVPLRRAALSLPRRRLAIADAVGAEDCLLRQWLAFTFAAELASGEGRQCARVHAVEMVASCEAWDRLRRAQGLSVPAASRVVATCLAALLHAGRVARR